MTRLILLLLSACVAMGATSLENARRARSLLGDRGWAKVIRVANTAADDARYPVVVDALVFEEAELLWFYTDRDGTQSLSLHRNCLAREKADLAPLLRAIDRGFTSFVVLPDARPTGKISAEDPLPNGCFIESLAALHEHIARGERIEQPRLLSCYALTAAGMRGHTVLTYLTPQGFFLLDPTRSAMPQRMPRGWVEKPFALAGAALEGVRILNARWIPLESPPTSIASTAQRSSVSHRT